MVRNTLKGYISGVQKKFNDPEMKMLLQFGQTYNPKATPLRDSLGMEMTYDTIMKTATNAWNFLDGRVTLAHSIKNFSSVGAGYEDVSNVRTIGAIDLTLIALSQSLIPYVCVDRGLATPEATIYFNNLVSNSEDGVGGVQNGAQVSGNFTPPNTDVYLGNGREGAMAAGNPVINLGADILPKTVTVKVNDGKTTYQGHDFDGTGRIYFDGGNVSAAVDYKTGNITLTNVTTETVNAEASIDPTKDETGSNVLTVMPQWTAIQLISEPMNIIFQNNIANMMFMQKTYTLATGSASSPYNDVLFQRVKNTYIEAINSMIIAKLIVATAPYKPLSVDLSTYDVRGFSNTKNDQVCQLISSMRATLLGRTGCGLSALIVNSNFAAVLEQIPVQFVANPNINMGINGLIGYFNGVPVFRHNKLDNKFKGYDPASDGVAFGVYRNPDNTSGTQVFGEFIPFTATGNVMNYAQPTQNSTGYFSQVGSKIIQDNLVVKGVIRLSANSSVEAGNNLFTDFTKAM